MITKRNTQVEKLLNIKTVSNNKFLTIYHTLSNLEDKIVEKEIRSLIIEAFRKENAGDTYKVLIDRVIEEVLRNKPVKFGLAIFLKFDDAGNFEDEDLVVHYSKFTPATKSFLGDVFDLSTLAGMSEEGTSLFINISRGDTKVYSLENDSLDLLKTLDNAILERMEDRFTNVQRTASGIGSGGVQSSSGNMQEKEDKFVRTIVNQMIEDVKKMNNQNNAYDSILIVYSSDFAIDADYMKENLKHLSSKEIITEQINIDYEKNLRDKVAEIINNHTKNEVENILTEYKTKIDVRLHEDTEEIFEFIRNSNVQKLFINDEVVKEGYLLSNSLPYLEQYPEAEHKENIIPYIVKNVLEADGEVYLLDKNYKGNVLMAIPRY